MKCHGGGEGVKKCPKLGYVRLRKIRKTVWKSSLNYSESCKLVVTCLVSVQHLKTKMKNENEAKKIQGQIHDWTGFGNLFNKNLKMNNWCKFVTFLNAKIFWMIYDFFLKTHVEETFKLYYFGATKQGQGTCSTFKPFNLTYLHVLRS